MADRPWSTMQHAMQHETMTHECMLPTKFSMWRQLYTSGSTRYEVFTGPFINY